MTTSQIASFTSASSPCSFLGPGWPFVRPAGRRRGWSPAAPRVESASVATVDSTRATRWVRATPDEVYRALLDPHAVAAWRVPNGMTATIHQFDVREGGRFRISLHPHGPEMASGSAETFHGRFTRLLPGQLVVEAIEFESPDPSMAGVLTITTELREADGGCEVTMAYDDIPDGADAARPTRSRCRWPWSGWPRGSRRTGAGRPGLGTGSTLQVRGWPAGPRAAASRRCGTSPPWAG